MQDRASVHPTVKRAPSDFDRVESMLKARLAGSNTQRTAPKHNPLLATLLEKQRAEAQAEARAVCSIKLKPTQFNRINSCLRKASAGPVSERDLLRGKRALKPTQTIVSEGMVGNSSLTYGRRSKEELLQSLLRTRQENEQAEAASVCSIRLRPHQYNRIVSALSKRSRRNDFTFGAIRDRATKEAQEICSMRNALPAQNLANIARSIRSRKSLSPYPVSMCEIGEQRVWVPSPSNCEIAAEETRTAQEICRTRATTRHDICKTISECLERVKEENAALALYKSVSDRETADAQRICSGAAQINDATRASLNACIGRHNKAKAENLQRPSLVTNFHQIMELGFRDKRAIVDALISTQNDLNGAVYLLVLDDLQKHRFE